MAINRAPFNALVDDTGDELTGSMWNKAAIQSVLLDPIDAMIAGGTKPIFLTSTTTGVQNAWTLPEFGDDTVIHWAGSTDLTINGLAGGAVGRRVTIKNMAVGGTIYVPHMSGSAAANCQLYNVVASGATPIAGHGSVTYVSRGDLWILVAHEQGAWITPPYSAANYGYMTVAAGQVRTHAYRLDGRSLTLTLSLENFTIDAGGNGLFVRVPYTIALYAVSSAFTYGPPVGWESNSQALTNPGQTAVTFYRPPGQANWTAGTGILYSTMTFAIT